MDEGFVSVLPDLQEVVTMEPIVLLLPTMFRSCP